MPENNDPQTNERDEALASFTDQLLEQPLADETSGPAADEELTDLQETVTMLWSLFEREEPDDALRDRIYHNLVAEWKELEAEQSSPSIRAWLSERLKIQGSGQGLTFATAFVVIVLIAAIGLLVSPAGEQLTGAAGSGGVIAIVAVGAGGLLIGLFWWLENQNK